MNATELQKAIMRRVYYSYVLSIFSQTVFWQGMFLSVSAVLLARWLHVASIVDNFLSVPVRMVPQYISNSFLGAIAHGEVITAVTLVLAGVVFVSAGYHIAQALSVRAGVVSRV